MSHRFSASVAGSGQFWSPALPNRHNQYLMTFVFRGTAGKDARLLGETPKNEVRPWQSVFTHSQPGLEIFPDVLRWSLEDHTTC